MDFGEILNQWEQGDYKSGKEGGNTGGASDDFQKQARKTVHPIDAWLRTNKIIDKDALADPDQDSAAERRRRLRLKKPDDQIDIHGLTRDEAWTALGHFFMNSRDRGLEKVLIIHGKGNHSQDKAVLKHCVRDFLEQCTFAGESGQGETGGSGSTWVLLKQSRN